MDARRHRINNSTRFKYSAVCVLYIQPDMQRDNGSVSFHSFNGASSLKFQIILIFMFNIIVRFTYNKCFACFEHF